VDKKQELEVKLRFLRNAEKIAGNAHQSERSRVAGLHAQLDSIQSEKNRSMEAIKSSLIEGEREQERLRAEHEIAKGLVLQLEAEARRHGLMLELQAAGGALEAAEDLAGA
jgi:hypothetical protein